MFVDDAFVDATIAWGPMELGSFKDISSRMDVFPQRAFIDGWELEKVVWTVPQGFGAEE